MFLELQTFKELSFYLMLTKSVFYEISLTKRHWIMYCKGSDIKEMAEHFQRTKGAIWARIRKLELEDLYG